MKTIIVNSFHSLIVLTFFATFFTSCEKYLEFEGEYKTPKIVVNSKITPDSTFLVHLSRSLSVIDNGELSSIENGTVSILDANDNLIETLVYDSQGFYKGANSPVASQTYKVKVSAPNYKGVEAKTKIPNSVSIISVDTSSYVNTDGDTLLKLRISFNDPANETNYYQIKMGFGSLISGQFYFNPAQFSSNDISLDLDQNQMVEFATFTDELFDGVTKTLEVSCNDYSAYYDFLQISITSVSNDVYLYDKALNLYSTTNGDIFSEPVQVYSNVTNGFGIFGGFQTTRFKINF